MLAANLFIDYGDNFPGGTLMTTQGAFRDIAGTSGGHNPILGTQLTQTNGFNATGGLNIVAQPYTPTERANALAVVTRAYAGLDVNVIELTGTNQTTPDGRIVQAASSMADVITTLRGGTATWKDAYVFVATFIADPGGTNQRIYGHNGGGSNGGGLSPGANGFGETTDLNAAANNHDDVAVVYDASSFGHNTRNNIAHEAGHNFGLRHGITNSITTNNDNSVTPAAINLMHQADVMSYRNTNNTTSSVAFTRYPVIRGDGNSPGSETLGNYDDLAPRLGHLSNYDQAAADANIGPKPNTTFVSGTGTHDRITLTRNGANVDVSIEAFEDSAFSTSIEVPGTAVSGGSYTYSFPVNANSILIQAGGSDDEIVINGDLGMNVVLDGMLGTDDLIVDGLGTSNIAFEPNPTSTPGADLVASYGGVITVGSNTITYSNFEPTSIVEIEGAVDLTLDTALWPKR